MGPVLVIVGPTASGKTGLAQRLSRSLPLRLLSADSQLVYRGLDIGTAKPMGADRGAWGLIDLVDPGQPFSAGEFCRQALPLVEEAWKARQVPTFAGGTGLYLKALLEGLAEIPPIPAAIRESLEQDFQAWGLEPLLQRLDAADPALARALDRKNPRRVLRALEVYEATGVPLSHWQRETKALLKPTRALWLGLDPGKELLEGRIEARVNENFREGWVDEVRQLRGEWGSRALSQSAAIGYPEILRHLDGQLSLDQAQAEILSQTRQYARRPQRTWFKAQASVQWAATAEAAATNPDLATLFT